MCNGIPCALWEQRRSSCFLQLSYCNYSQITCRHVIPAGQTIEKDLQEKALEPIHTHRTCSHQASSGALFPNGMWVVITAAWCGHLDEWAVEFGEIIKEPDFHTAPDNKWGVSLPLAVLHSELYFLRLMDLLFLSQQCPLSNLPLSAWCLPFPSSLSLLFLRLHPQVLKETTFSKATDFLSCLLSEDLLMVQLCNRIFEFVPFPASNCLCSFSFFKKVHLLQTLPRN